jgi:hypothetical protein
MPEAQSYKNHGRLDPPFHIVIFGVLAINLINAIFRTVHEWPQHVGFHLWEIVFAFILIMMALKIRMYALHNQDRIIRLEEKLRFAALGLRDFEALTEKQYVALRFASDAELPGLVARTLKEHLTPKEIKKGIVEWRADDFRI